MRFTKTKVRRAGIFTDEISLEVVSILSIIRWLMFKTSIYNAA